MNVKDSHIRVVASDVSIVVTQLSNAPGRLAVPFEALETARWYRHDVRYIVWYMMTGGEVRAGEMGSVDLSSI